MDTKSKTDQAAVRRRYAKGLAKRLTEIRATVQEIAVTVSALAQRSEQSEQQERDYNGS
jgi:hypothetical protein